MNGIGSIELGDIDPGFLQKNILAAREETKGGHDMGHSNVGNLVRVSNSIMNSLIELLT